MAIPQSIRSFWNGKPALAPFVFSPKIAPYLQRDNGSGRSGLPKSVTLFGGEILPLASKITPFLRRTTQDDRRRDALVYPGNSINGRERFMSILARNTELHEQGGSWKDRFCSLWLPELFGNVFVTGWSGEANPPMFVLEFFLYRPMMSAPGFTYEALELRRATERERTEEGRGEWVQKRIWTGTEWRWEWRFEFGDKRKRKEGLARPVHYPA